MRKIYFSGKHSDEFVLVDNEDYQKYGGMRWYKSRYGYAYKTYKTRVEDDLYRCGTIYLHHLINPTPKGMYTDHINGDTADNRRANLRLVTPQQNNQNTTRRAKGSSKYRGVCWDKRYGKWIASIKINKVSHHLGHFDDEVEAAKAWDKRALKEMGEYVRPNFEASYAE